MAYAEIFPNFPKSTNLNTNTREAVDLAAWTWEKLECDFQ